MKLYRVHFRIAGVVEIEAEDGAEAWALGHEMGPRELVEGDPAAIVEIEYVEYEDQE